jgi:membrane protein implicated in regulation of membrane protease activity
MSYWQELGLGLWFTIALVALIAEFFLPALVAFFIAVGAVSAAVTLLLGGGVSLQITVFVAVGVLSSLLIRPLIAKKWRKEKSAVSGPERLIGEVGSVISINPNLAVKVSGQDWSCRVIGEDDITMSDQVIVEGVDGAHLLVRKFIKQ